MFLLKVDQKAKMLEVNCAVCCMHVGDAIVTGNIIDVTGQSMRGINITS